MLFRDVDDALYSLLLTCRTSGEEVTVRGMTTMELLLASFMVAKPLHRVVYNQARKGNVFAQIAETLWMLSGRDDLDWLERYIPQCKRWSDDDKTWRAAYGPRLRNWSDGSWGGEHTDQIAHVVEKLIIDPNTRQAVISMWDPAQDWVKGSKDYPCNNWLHFINRDGKLHLNVSGRSNDLIYGFSHMDFFGWSVLLQLVAHWTGAEVGYIGWNVTSLHIYDRHYEKADAIIAAYVDDNIEESEKMDPPPVTTPFHEFDYAIRNVMYDNAIPTEAPANDLLSVMVYMVQIYNYYLDNVKNALCGDEPLIHLKIMVHRMPPCDMRDAATMFFTRVIGDDYITCDTTNS